MGPICLASLLDTLFRPHTMRIVLAGGLGLLTVALLVLSRCRWGQARPLSKCVALSVFAHLLLLGYAHLTRLWNPPGLGSDPSAIQVRLVATTDEMCDNIEPTRSAARAAEPLADSPSPAPERAELAPRSHQPDTGELAGTTATDWPGAEPARELPRLDDPDWASHPPTPRPAEPAAIATLAMALDAREEARANRTPAPAAAIETARDGPSTPPQTAERPPSPRPTDAQSHVQDVAAGGDAPPPQTLPPDDQALASTRAGAAPDASRPAGESAEPRPHTVPPPTVGQSSSVKDAPAADTWSPPVLMNGHPLPRAYAGRGRADRLQYASRQGGSANTEAAVEASLAWLAANQAPDGRWDASAFGAGRETLTLGQHRYGTGANADTGISGLVLLAFLGAGNTHVSGQYRQPVQRGLEYLLASQRYDGSLAGQADFFAAMYCHGIATLAVGEAYAMTGDARIEPYLARAVRYTAATQHPVSGGWRYRPGDPGDMSQFGWQLMALVSAKHGGIAVPETTLTGMHNFLSSSSSGRAGGLAGYRRGQTPTATMTAEALVCRLFLGGPAPQAAIDEAADMLVAELPGLQGKPNLYYWYYGTLALYQLQDQRWERWNSALQSALLPRQESTGDMAGSWSPDTVWGGYGGRFYSTAMATLCLEVYYRYLPLYELARVPDP